MLSRRQNAGQNHDIKIANRGLDNVAEFKYLGRTVTNQILIQEESKRGLISCSACYYSVQNLLSSCMLSENLNFNIHRTIILRVVLVSDIHAWTQFAFLPKQ
jgi:hydrogenase maturation factor HypE